MLKAVTCVFTLNYSDLVCSHYRLFRGRGGGIFCEARLTISPALKTLTGLIWPNKPLSTRKASQIV